jgi:biopolymer transport protein ExbD
MKVFKYLAALADISVGFLGLFFVIFSVTRPSLQTTARERQQLEQTVRQLQDEIRQLEEIKLAKSRSAGKKLATAGAAKIMITGQAITAEISGRKSSFATINSFVAGTQAWRWPANVILYVDYRVPFERVVHVIDALKQTNEDISVQIAALVR